MDRWMDRWMGRGAAACHCDTNRAFNNPLPSRKPGMQCTCKEDSATKPSRCKKAGTSCGPSCHSGKPCGNALADAGADEEDVESGIALTDSVATKCSNFLRTNFPEFDGLSSPAILKVRSIISSSVGERVQTHHLDAQHWVCSYSLTSNPGRVEMFDSMKLPQNLPKDLSAHPYQFRVKKILKK